MLHTALIFCLLLKKVKKFCFTQDLEKKKNETEGEGNKCGRGRRRAPVQFGGTEAHRDNSQEAGGGRPLGGRNFVDFTVETDDLLHNEDDCSSRMHFGRYFKNV